MNCFSRKATNKCYEDDFSYPSPKVQLLWRLEELKTRYEELIDEDFAYQNSLILMEDDLRYALPENLHSIRHIKAAIELAELDLREKYGILVNDDFKSISQTRTQNEKDILIIINNTMINHFAA